MKSKKRIQWLDFAKGFTIFFVVLAHCVSELFQPQFHSNMYINLLYYVLFLFIMPIFFSISGYLYKSVSTVKGYLLLIYKKSISLLLPYFFISIITTIGKRIVGYHMPIKDCIIGFKACAALWFLPSLFVIFIMVGFLDLCHCKLYIQIILFILLMLLQSHFYVLSNDPTKWVHILPYMTLTYTLLFYLGIIIRKYFVLIISRNIYKTILIGFVLFILSIYIQLRFTALLYPTNNVSIVTLFGKIISVFLMFSLSMILVKKKMFNFFLKYGKYTLIIYLLNHPVITLTEFLIRKNFIIKNISFQYNIVLVFFISILIILFVCQLSRKFKLVNFVFYPRKYINKVVLKTKWGRKLLEN